MVELQWLGNNSTPDSEWRLEDGGREDKQYNQNIPVK